MHNAGYIPARRTKKRQITPWHLDTYAALIGERCRGLISTYTPEVFKLAMSMGDAVPTRGAPEGSKKGKSMYKERVSHKDGGVSTGGVSVGVVMRKAISDTGAGVSNALRTGAEEAQVVVRTFNSSTVPTLVHKGVVVCRDSGVKVITAAKGVVDRGVKACR